MLFNSPEFLFVFLPSVLAAFYIASRRSGGALKGLLFLSSVVFYAYWSVAFLPLLLGSVAANYAIGMRLSRVPSKGLLAAGIAANLGLLGYFKYAGWFVASINAVSTTTFAVPDILLPIGISFITFEQIAFIVDAYRGKVRNRRFVDYALFVTFFPQLIAGPIFHHREMCPQFADFRKGYSARADQVAQGLFLLFVGLFKKVVIADFFAGYANPVFEDPGSATFFDAWVGSLSYTLQLYFDFSAYSEMAMGLALFFGITIPVNFLSPYKSKNIREFWRRWHITLGRFLHEYLYVPLGGNRYGLARTAAALSTVMLLGGLWHGAGWTFVAWGAMHAAFLVIHRVWQRLGVPLPASLAVGITFISVVFAWVLFRAETLDDALVLWSSMVGLHGIVIPDTLRVVFGASDVLQFAQSAFFTGLEPLILLVALTAVWQLPNVQELRVGIRPTFRSWAGTVGAASAAIAVLGVPSVFAYWMF